ncbi:MAG: HAMP domain-containing histidine kinase [Phycisphaerales bacterium]|nr:HAMP domain-containing histidine kinase [Phycisphaerales bacterium]
MNLLIGAAIALAIAAPIAFVWLRRARRAEEEARRSQRLAELGSMTSGLAHEIKNPLSTVGLNAQLLIEDLRSAQLDTDEADRMIRRVETLRREVERLGGILGDFLQFAGRMRLDPQPLDIGGLVEGLGDFYNPQCEQAGVILRVQVPPSQAHATVDEGLFKQALLNLMINAVQAMQESGGDLMLRVQALADRVQVQVIDTGPGIAPDRQDAIFHPYVSGRKGGTGLGLPTARRIIEEHGGSLELASEEGKGTEFIIELPKVDMAADVPG